MKPKLQYYNFELAAVYLSEETREDYSAAHVDSLVEEGFFVSGCHNKSGEYSFLGVLDYLKLKRAGTIAKMMLYPTIESALYGSPDGHISFGTIDQAGIENVSVSRVELDGFIEKGENFDERRTLLSYLRWFVAKERGRTPKKIYLPNCLDEILRVLVVSIEGFDPSSMPGIKENFLNFCRLISNEEFSISPETIKAYLKLPGRKKPMCKWPQSARRDDQYWAEVVSQLKSKKINQI